MSNYEDEESPTENAPLFTSNPTSYLNQGYTVKHENKNRCWDATVWTWKLILFILMALAFYQAGIWQFDFDEGKG